MLSHNTERRKLAKDGKSAKRVADIEIICRTIVPSAGLSDSSMFSEIASFFSRTCFFSFVTGRSRNKRSQFTRERTCYSETKAQSEPQGRGIEGQFYSCLTEGNLRDDTYSEFC